MSSSDSVSEYLAPKKYFISLGGMTLQDFTTAVRENPKLTAEGTGYPVFAFLKHFYENYRLISGNSSIQEEKADMSLSKKTKQQMFLRLCIRNEKELSLLLPKSEAEARIVNILAGLSSLLRSSIQMAASKLDGNTRDNAELITACFRDLFEKVYENGNKITWKDDGDMDALKKRLMSSIDDDDEIKAVVEGLYDTDVS